jgi:hypothetical protein
MYRVKGSDQNVYGPIPSETVRQWISERRLDRTSEVCREGEETWVTLGQMPEFADALGAMPGTMPGVMPGVGGASTAPNFGYVGGATVGGAPDERVLALARVQGPAIGLAIYGGLMMLMRVVGLVATAVMPKGGQIDLPAEAPEFLRKAMALQASMPPWASYLQSLIGLAVFAVVLVGGLRLMKLRSKGLVMAGAVLAILPCFSSCCCLIGMPLGIWVILTINKPEISSQFE